MLVLLAAVISGGCVSYVPLEPVLVREPRPEPVPLRIGVYYSPEFRSFTYRDHSITDTEWILGKPSVQLLHKALTLLFIEVVEVPWHELGPSLRSDLAGVIEPRIVSAEAVMLSEEIIKTGVIVAPSHITYGFTLYSPSGKPVVSWDVSGRGEEPFSTINPFAIVSVVKRNFEQAMREAAWNLTSGFREIPEVRQWLAKQAVRKD